MGNPMQHGLIQSDSLPDYTLDPISANSVSSGFTDCDSDLERNVHGAFFSESVHNSNATAAKRPDCPVVAIE